MGDSWSMTQIAELIKQHDAELRHDLMTSRSGLFRKDSGELYVRSDVPLGQSYSEEVIGIFSDAADLDLFYKLYLEKE